MSRCTGHCCTCFTFPWSPEVLELVDQAEQGRARGEDWPEGVPQLQDGATIAAMVVPIGPGIEGTGLFEYTCKHYDADSGNCTAYDSRPQMCREYPYGRPCPWADCTMAPA